MNEHEKNARIFKAFCDANRLTILELLRGGEKCACRLLEELRIGQPTLSHHMKVLCDAGVVRGRKEGKWMHYSLNQEGLEKAEKFLERLSSAAEGDGCLCGSPDLCA